jgi:hypothetical protein
LRRNWRSSTPPSASIHSRQCIALQIPDALRPRQVAANQSVHASWMRWTALWRGKGASGGYERRSALGISPTVQPCRAFIVSSNEPPPVRRINADCRSEFLLPTVRFLACATPDEVGELFQDWWRARISRTRGANSSRLMVT